MCYTLDKVIVFRKNLKSKQKTHTYQRLFTENPKEQVRDLLEDYKKEHGKVPICNDLERRS